MVVSVVVLILDTLAPNIQWLKALRVLRALKPLRLALQQSGHKAADAPCSKTMYITDHSQRNMGCPCLDLKNIDKPTPTLWLTKKVLCCIAAIFVLCDCRTLTRSPGMMLVFRSVTLSLASMANVSIVVGLFFLIFAIMGVQLFGGRFWTCNDTTVANKVMLTQVILTLELLMGD